MDDELRKPIKWDRPCYKCGSHYCDLSCPDRANNANAAPEFSVGVDTGSADGTSVVVAQKMPDGAIKIIHSQYYPAPQDQDAKDAARYRWLRDHASNDWLDSGITDDAVDEAINDKSQWRKRHDV